MTKTEMLAYFAGIIDGEGHVGCQTYSGAKRPVIQVNMTHRPTVKAYCDFFGTTLRELHAPSQEVGYAKGYKQMYHTRSECHRAYEIIKQVRPYLITKVVEADVILAYYEGRHCQVCNRELPVAKNKGVKYCSAACRQKNKRIIAKEKGEPKPP